VRVVYTKYNGSMHWHHTMRHLGEDSRGVWLGAPAGTRTRRGGEPPVLIEGPFVQLFPPGQWWTATFNGEPSGVDIYCDIGTPPRWLRPDEVTMIDLDLDVLRRRADRRVLLVDDDEFAEHQVRFSYPPDTISQAEQAAAWLLDAVTNGTEPFGSEYRAWLSKITRTASGDGAERAVGGLPG
jgi:uncharacterized protein